jgi:adenylate cyclase
MHNVMWGYSIDPDFDRKEAIRHFRLALSLDDGDSETLALAAVTSAFLVGDSENAMELADWAVALNPNSFTAWACRGWAYKVAGLLEEAIRSFEHAMRMSPIDPALHRVLLGMAQALIELRRFDEAIVVAKKAQREKLITHTCLASAYAHLGRDAEAREGGGACG